VGRPDRLRQITPHTIGTTAPDRPDDPPSVGRASDVPATCVPSSNSPPGTRFENTEKPRAWTCRFFVELRVMELLTCCLPTSDVRWRPPMPMEVRSFRNFVIPASTYDARRSVQAGRDNHGQVRLAEANEPRNGASTSNQTDLSVRQQLHRLALATISSGSPDLGLRPDRGPIDRHTTVYPIVCPGPVFRVRSVTVRRCPASCALSPVHRYGQHTDPSPQRDPTWRTRPPGIAAVSAVAGGQISFRAPDWPIVEEIWRLSKELFGPFRRCQARSKPKKQRTPGRGPGGSSWSLGELNP
jgi:hypothetical protein